MRLLVSRAGQVGQLAYAADGLELTAFTGDRCIERWDLSAAEPNAQTVLSDRPVQVAFAPRADVLAFAEVNRVGAGNVASKRLPSVFADGAPIEALALTADATMLVFARRRSPPSQALGSEIRLLPVADLTEPERGRSLFSAIHVRMLAFSPDGRYLATAGYEQMTLWDLLLSESIILSSMKSSTQFVFSPESPTLAIASEGVIHLWDRRPNPVWPKVGNQIRMRVRAMSYSPDGRVLATGQERDVRFWDPNDGRQIAQWDWNIGTISALAFAPDGLTVAAGSDSGQIVIWDLDE